MSISDPPIDGEIFEADEPIVRALPSKDDSGLLETALAIDATERTRVAAINLLRDRQATGAVTQLLGLLADSDSTPKIRRVTLRALVDNRVTDALPTIQCLCDQIDPKYDGLGLVFVGYDNESLMRARGLLGDETALRGLIGRYATAEQNDARDHLIESLGGLPAAAAHLCVSSTELASASTAEQLRWLADHDPDAGVRRWALDRLAESPASTSAQFYADRLMDSSHTVRSGASDILMASSEPPVSTLQEMAGNPQLSDSSRLWATYTLCRMGIEAADLLTRIPNGRIELPSVVPHELRASIVHEWVKPWNRDDIRWCIEREQLPDQPPYDLNDSIDRLRAQLQAAGLRAQDAIDCGDFYQQGGGTYSLLPLESDIEDREPFLYVSSLGPFVSYSLHVIIRYENGHSRSPHLTNIAAVDLDGRWRDQASLCSSIAAAAGFMWVGEDLLKVKVPGLAGLYPYQDDEIDVKTLLYYWVD